MSETERRAAGVLAGRRALITGGTRGIGRGIALAMAAAGAHVVVTGRGVANGEAVTDAIREGGGRADYVAADLADDEAVDALIPRVLEVHGGLDILVNNAGIDGDAPAFNYPLDDWRRILRFNLEVPFRLSNAAAEHFFARQFGVVINLASIQGLRGAAEGVAYAASKHGLIGMTRTQAIEWAGKGVRVNAIAPGLIETDMTQPYFDAPGFTAGYVKSRIPAKRAGRPSDIGGAAVFLASDAADFIHGEVLVIDGGTLA